jgi:hypothetical protein
MLDRPKSIPRDSYTIKAILPAPNGGTADAPFIKSSAEFVAGFVPPDYLWDGILQRRFCYSLTGATGGVKTAIALLLASSVALAGMVAGRQFERGRVLYFAGENPDDVRMRWIAMAEHMGFDIDAIDVHFIPGVFNLDEIEAGVRAEAQKLGGMVLVIVDTSAAYFLGEDENSNVQMGAHARRFRGLTTLPGEPTVLVLCHPVKNATSDNLVPRGGSAFLAEVDGNLTAARTGETTTLHWQRKYRGPDFEPMPFELCPVTADLLKDSKGRNLPTVIARALTDAEQQAEAAESRSHEDAVLMLLLDHEEGLPYAAIAKRLRWVNAEGQPNKSRVFRVVDRLVRAKLLIKERGTPALTEKGKAAAKRAKSKHGGAGALDG